MQELLDTSPGAARSSLAAASEAGRDWQREGCIVLLGSTAKHLSKDDPKVVKTIDTLIEALQTPSESVQRAVAKCLPALAKMVKDLPDRVSALFTTVLERTVRGKSYGERRGGAFGLAGLVKGLGLQSLKTNSAMPALEAAAADAKAPESREGAMLAFECLGEALGMLFEPYVIRILPLLLKSFGDATPSVRDAAACTSKVIMSKLSAHGVKLVIDPLLDGLAETQWRSKQASILLLGSMAFCSPQQLSTCLPRVRARCGVMRRAMPRRASAYTRVGAHADRAAPVRRVHGRAPEGAGGGAPGAHRDWQSHSQ